MHNRKAILLLALFLTAAWSLTVFATDAPKYRQSDLNRRMEMARIAGAEEGPFESSSRTTWGSDVAVGSDTVPGSPGYRIGETTYDYQHNGSTGRQVDKLNQYIQATWMKGNDFTLGNRQVQWNRMEIDGSLEPITLDNGNSLNALPLTGPLTTNGTAVVTGGTRPGYTTFRLLPGSGRGAAFLHDAPETGPGAFAQASVSTAQNQGIFLTVVADQPPGIEPGDEVIWPKGTTDIVGTQTILHMVARGSGDDSYDPWYYWRGTLVSTTLTWEDPVFIDSGATISHVIEQDPTSDEVAIVYCRTINYRYTGGAAQVYNDLMIRRSTNGGVSWNAPEFVTQQDTLTAGYFPYTDVDAVYDDGGVLHIIYNTRRYYDDDGDGEEDLFNVPVHMWHWNDVRQTSREISSLDTSNVCNEAGNPFLTGSWNLLMCKPSLTVKPAGLNGIAQEIIYALWVQSGPTETDCASQDSAGTLGGYVNAEIWCSASSDDGLTWDRPVNITGTESPDCTPGNCRSEHWVTAAARADSGMYLSYTMDTHAGGIVQDEGAWSTSPYMVYAPEARAPVVEPRISVSPTNFIELHVNPDASASVLVTVNNVGNDDLIFDAAVMPDNEGLQHVLVNGTQDLQNVTIPAAAAPQVLTIDFDGVELENPSEWNWRIEITSNDPANDPGQAGTPININLNVFVADPWFTRTSKTFENGQRQLEVYSTLAIGDQGGLGGLGSLADSSAWMFEASPVLAYNGTSLTTSWVDMFWGSVSDRSRDSNRAYRAQDTISLQTGMEVISGNDDTLVATRAYGVASTTDTAFQLDWEIFMYENPEFVDGFVAHYTVSKLKDLGLLGTLQYGAATDLDVDSLSAWNDGIVSDARQYVGSRGGYGDDSVGQSSYVPQNKFAAMFYVPVDGECADRGEGAQVLDNPTYVYPEGNYNRDSLRLLMARIVGWNADNYPTDTISDLNVLMKHGERVLTSGAMEPFEFAFGVAVSDLSESDLASKIQRLRSAFNPACVYGCLIAIAGDVNESGNITSADIIACVNFVFKGGLPPEPCEANGDVNCSGSVTSADIISLVNHVFKGQAPPCDICNSGTPLALQCR